MEFFFFRPSFPISALLSNIEWWKFNENAFSKTCFFLLSSTLQLYQDLWWCKGWMKSNLLRNHLVSGHFCEGMLEILNLVADTCFVQFSGWRHEVDVDDRQKRQHRDKIYFFYFRFRNAEKISAPSFYYNVFVLILILRIKKEVNQRTLLIFLQVRKMSSHYIRDLWLKS